MIYTCPAGQCFGPEPITDCDHVRRLGGKAYRASHGVSSGVSRSSGREASVLLVLDDTISPSGRRNDGKMFDARRDAWVSFR